MQKTPSELRRELAGFIAARSRWPRWTISAWLAAGQFVALAGAWMFVRAGMVVAPERTANFLRSWSGRTQEGRNRG